MISKTKHHMLQVKTLKEEGVSLGSESLAERALELLMPGDGPGGWVGYGIRSWVKSTNPTVVVVGC